MLNTLDHLTPRQQAQLQHFVYKINRVIPSEKIICYGSRTDRKRAWGCFHHGDSRHDTVTYDLLIIPRPESRRPAPEILDMLDKQQSKKVHATFIVHFLPRVNDAIEKGSRFFSTLQRTGITLYQESKIPLATPSPDLSQADWLNEAREIWGHAITRARLFMDAAELYRSRKAFAFSAFMLHQVMEHVAAGLLEALAGYRTSFHNIERLMDMLPIVGFDGRYFFPGNTSEEKALLEILRRSYSDARYKHEFAVSEEVADILYRRVKYMLSTAEIFYEQKIAAWAGRVERVHVNTIVFTQPLELALYEESNHLKNVI